MGRAERGLRELTRTLPCDFLVLKYRGFDPEQFLVPTAGGPHPDLSAEVAAVLCGEVDAEVTLLHVVDDVSRRETGEAFLSELAVDHGLDDPGQAVDEAECSVLLAERPSERSLVDRLFGGGSGR